MDLEQVDAFMAKCCFVIMPFGVKKDPDGSAKVDYDKVYDDLIEPAVRQLGVECLRCDKIGKPGLVHGQMIEKIHSADIAVVDISTLNPNVFYELGVRQALKPGITVLIRKTGTKLPFNIQGLSVIEYDPKNLKSAVTRRQIGDFIQAGQGSNVDSLVHSVLKLKISSEPRVLGQNETYPYLLAENPRKGIYITTGDITTVRGIDIWVNSENTNMQMARFYDKSVSSVIRFRGAERDRSNRIVKDVIADELESIVGRHQTVPDATVIDTSAGRLAATNDVQRIFHVAAVAGAVGKGYQPIRDVAQCVTNALEKVDAEFRDAGYSSILFPLLGTGTARGFEALERCVEPLFDAAIEHLRRNPKSRLQRVHFQAWTEEDLAACRDVLGRRRELKPRAKVAGKLGRQRR